MLTPAFIAAMVERSHGQVILTEREIHAAGLLSLEVTRNERSEVVIRTAQHPKPASAIHETKPDGF